MPKELRLLSISIVTPRILYLILIIVDFCVTLLSFFGGCRECFVCRNGGNRVVGTVSHVCLCYFWCKVSMVPTFSDWQISQTFPVFFPIFQYFLGVWFNEFNKYKALFNKCISIKKSEKNISKNWLKFPQFSIIWGKTTSVFQYFG